MPQRVARTTGSPVVAIDGPAGSGKSSVARAVAARLGLRYLDTGAMYRAVTWRALEQGLDPTDAVAMSGLAAAVRIEMATDPQDPGVRVDGRPVSAEIRSRAVANAVSAVSAHPGVRAPIIAEQRRLIDGGGIVVEGRDIGTVVAPDADLKVFLTAAPAVRAARRHAEQPTEAAAGDTLSEIVRRDALDTDRTVSPLTAAADAIVLDSSGRTLDEVVAAVLAQCASLA
ncbi:MAG: (d)CMP kinase [Mycobacteriales bacterium]